MTLPQFEPSQSAYNPQPRTYLSVDSPAELVKQSIHPGAARHQGQHETYPPPTHTSLKPLTPPHLWSALRKEPHASP